MVVAWCHLGVTYLFNRVPHPAGGPYAGFRDRYWAGFEARPRSPFTAVRLGPIQALVG